MRDDMKNERPGWPFSSYGHKREAPCDLIGDFSFEEVSADMEPCKATGLSYYIGRMHDEVLSSLNSANAFVQVRWTEMEAVRRGKPPAALLADFKVAMRSNEQQWQVHGLPKCSLRSTSWNGL